MRMLRVLSFSLASATLARASFAEAAGQSTVTRKTNVRENVPFMINSGISAPEEMCLAVENGLVDTIGAEVLLMRCLDAIAAGDGRELFSFQSGGKLMSVVGKHCVALSNNDVVDGGALVLEPCDAAAKSGHGHASFELQGAVPTARLETCVRKCACVCKCVHLCVCVCVQVCAGACAGLCVRVWMCVQMCAGCVQVCAGVCRCVQVCVQVCAGVCRCVQLCAGV